MSTNIKQLIQQTDIAELKPLGSLELQVMQVIWRREKDGEEATTVRHAFEIICTSENMIAYTSILTTARRLRDKGWLKQVKEVDRTFYYHSTRSRQAVGHELLRWTVQEFFDGDSPPYVPADEEPEDAWKLAVVMEC